MPILCSSFGLVSPLLHDFCHETQHTADFYFWSLVIKNKHQAWMISKVSYNDRNLLCAVGFMCAHVQLHVCTFTVEMHVQP